MISLTYTATLFFLVTGLYSAESANYQLSRGEQAEYRILERSRPYVETVLTYEINVNKYLVRVDLEQLICQFVKTERPEDFKTLRLNFYYELDEFIPSIGDPGLAKKNWNHFLGTYTWNDFWAEKKGGGTIRIVKDISGRDLPRPETFLFDHLTACRD